MNENLSICAVCGNVDTSNPVRDLCRWEARSPLVMRRREVSDLWALDRSRLFPGVPRLGGRLSALEGIRRGSDDRQLVHALPPWIDESAGDECDPGVRRPLYLAERWAFSDSSDPACSWSAVGANWII